MAFARWREVVVAEKDILVEQGGVAAKKKERPSLCLSTHTTS
jgi:hypothetical protein